MAPSFAASRSMLESLVNHVALPPQLPGKQENSIEHIERALTDRLADASCIIRNLTNHECFETWDRMRSLLQTCKTLNAGRKLNKKLLIQEFQRLDHKGQLVLHVTEQNAGLLIRRLHE